MQFRSAHGISPGHLTAEENGKGCLVFVTLKGESCDCIVQGKNELIFCSVV